MKSGQNRSGLSVGIGLLVLGWLAVLAPGARPAEGAEGADTARAGSGGPAVLILNVATGKYGEPIVTVASEVDHPALALAGAGGGHPLRERVKAFHTAHKDQPVAIKADADLPFAQVERVMAECAVAGATDLAFVVGQDKAVLCRMRVFEVKAGRNGGAGLPEPEWALEVAVVAGDKEPTLRVAGMGIPQFVKLADAGKVLAEDARRANVAGHKGAEVRLSHRGASYGEMVGVYRACREAGWTKVGFVASREAGPVGGIPNVGGATTNPAKPMKEDVTGIDLGGLSGGADPETSGRAGGGPGKGIGTGAGAVSDDGTGPLAPFSPPGGGLNGPRGAVFGNGGNARSIVFVCDASGSMLDKFADLKVELNKAVSGLRVPQSFNVVFMQENKASALSEDALLIATPENKRKAAAFVDDAVTLGPSDPLPALRLAFAQKPQLVYLLTDGDFPDNKAVLDELKKLDPEHKVKVNTIAFVSNEEPDPKFVDVLTKIAKDTGGSYRRVKTADLE